MAETYIPPMTESKAAADKRLHAEGRWGKFAAHRLSLVRKLKKERGGTKGEVNDDAWALALASFPPLKVGDGCDPKPTRAVTASAQPNAGSVAASDPAHAPSSSTAERPADEPADMDAGSNPALEPEKCGPDPQIGPPAVTLPECPVDPASGDFGDSLKNFPADPSGVETAAQNLPAASLLSNGAPPLPEPEDHYEGELPPAAASSADLTRDILWVYQNLEKRFVRDLPPAPSGGAISLWRWAKANRNKFFADVLPKAARAADQTDEEKGAAAGDRGQVESIGGMLGKLRGEIEERALLFCVNCGGKLGRAQ